MPARPSSKENRAVSEIVVVGSLKARPGKEDEAAEALATLVEPTHGEAGCILYSLNQGVADKARFAFVERWASQEDLDKHLQSDHIAAVLARADELLSEAPDIVVYSAMPLGDARKGSIAGHAA
jgi:quinol monooxygenase YgiN